jgi:hypothetical protein
MAQFKYMGMTVANQTLVQEKIEKGLNWSNAWYNAVQNILFSCLLSENVKLEYTKLYFACGFVWVWNLVSDIEEGTWAGGIWKQDAEKNIWTEERLSGRRLEENSQREASKLFVQYN